LNTNPEFLIWGEHNGFLKHIAAAYYEAPRPRFPNDKGVSLIGRLLGLRPSRDFQNRFQEFIRSFFADPARKIPRWGFKEIRYYHSKDDQLLRLMIDCFPKTRIIILVREPEASIVSMVTSWSFTEAQKVNLTNADVDREIFAKAAHWNTIYEQLYTFSETYRGHCVNVRYEDLGRPETYRDLAGVLETSPFDYLSRVNQVKSGGDQTSDTAALIKERMRSVRQQVAGITSKVGSHYGYE
jgi:hypothetical protein